MQKAIREIKEKQRIADIFLIILDSRAPISTYNYDFEKIAPHKPRLFVFSKPDLADFSKLNSIIDQFKKNNNVVVANLNSKNSRKKIINAIHDVLIDKKASNDKKGIVNPRRRIFVLGIPNSGKSTLINLISNSKSTNVANRPGVTRGQQWISIGKFDLLDTPGILWPKIDNDEIAIKLIMIGSIRTEILQLDSIALNILILFSKKYPNELKKIGINPVNNRIEADIELEKIALNKFFIASKNKPDIKKTINWLINYIQKLKGVTYD